MSAKKKAMRKLGRTGQILGISVLIAVFLVPLYLGFIYSIKYENEVTLGRLAWPQHPTISNYIRVTTENSQSLVDYKDSILTAIPTVILLIVVTPVASWILARNRRKFYGAMYAIFALGILIPFRCIMLPLYLNLYRMGPVSPSLGFIIAGSGLQISIGVPVVINFIKTVPRELEEAASIDGCSRSQTFWRVVFPLMKSINATQAVLDTLFMWNGRSTAVVLLRDKMSRTLLLAQVVYFNENTAELNLAFTFFNMAMLPVLILYLCLQKYVVSGIMSGVVKG